MVWKKPEESAPKKAKITISAGKVMVIVFWDCKGVLLIDYLLPNTTVNAARYCEVLTKLRAAKKRKRPGLLSRKVLLVHDNARPHAARTTQTLLENFKWEIFTHPPYSPDLAPSDFHLFPALKLHLGGKHFANDDEVQAEANHWLRIGHALVQQWYQKIATMDDALELVYKSPSCEFNFAWLTMQMCYEKSKLLLLSGTYLCEFEPEQELICKLDEKRKNIKTIEIDYKCDFGYRSYLKFTPIDGSSYRRVQGICYLAKIP
ncbi:hypothetical protein LAZ67_15000881 [Cordylochernes scorpioides]|uniref:Transposase n=1 Tax=Cordylochernes scorpioides TaxID=51811 RepID=A0ABY6L8C8_9ARAC|nr:hypothetical protein LAZ67_15000881 [Cordylochernes scorpioides]